MIFLKFKSITYKWVFSFIASVTLVLFLTNLIIFIAVYQYFDNSAKETLKLNSSILNNEINSAIKDKSINITNKIKFLIENFTNYDNILIVGLNFKGDAVTTSSKLSLDSDYDFLKLYAGNSFEEAKFQKIKLKKTKDKVLVYPVKIPIVNENISNIIYITSLHKIKIIIKNILLITIIVDLVILLLVITSGVFFIKYFVNPVREINIIVKRISKGNLKYKIKKNYHYEIKDLCNSINFMAEEISNSEYLKNEFISSVSHELRTPLTAIKGWSETILSTKNQNQEILNKGMQIISKEVLRLSEMVEELLDFSKIQTGHFVLNKDKMDLFAELEEAVLIYSDVALKQGKILKYNEQKAIPIIYGDKNRIRQIFINIIDNALKYSEKGDSVIITTEVTNKKAIVTIKDTGYGISKKDLSHITEKFFKLHPTKKGSGIGLSIVKEIIEKHDGSIKFDSVLGKGTSVILEFNLYT